VSFLEIQRIKKQGESQHPQLGLDHPQKDGGTDKYTVKTVQTQYS
jgi:hypothetical protein